MIPVPVITPWFEDRDVCLYHGDALDTLRGLADCSVQMVVSSPPFWGLRDYGTGSWVGGDADCDHLGPVKATQAGFNERYFGTPPVDTDKQGELRKPFKSTCGRCGARRVDQQIGLEDTPSCGTGNGLMRLRSDLTADQRAFVARRLAEEASRDA